MLLLRKAVVADIPVIHQLINDYAAKGLMLRRPLLQLYEGLRDYAVAEDEGQLVAATGLHILWHDLAEIRSLSVAPPFTSRGIGRSLVSFVLEEARELGLNRVFAFTYQPGFFERCGFVVVKKEILPQKVWKECIYCDKFHNCDETAVIHYLDASAQRPENNDIPLVDVPRWKVT